MKSNVIEVVEHRTGIEHAVKLAGGAPKMAEQLDVSQQAVGQWIAKGFVSLERAKQIETLYGVPRAKLIDPDLVAFVLESEADSEGGEAG